jgi:hypothetical protein
MNHVLPSTQSIDIKSNNSNLAHSLTQFRKISEDSRNHGKVIGSERFDMRGQSGGRQDYKAQYPNSPFKQGNMTMNSTSVGKYSISRNDSERTEIVSNIITAENGGLVRKSRGSNYNQFSMQEIRDLDTSPEKRYHGL